MSVPKTYRLRYLECRVHHLLVEAETAEEAMESANEMDASDSMSDQFDSWEFMDIVEEGK